MTLFDPTGLEQEMLESVNRMRLAPSAEIRLLVNRFDPIGSAEPNIDSALKYFNVDGNLLRSQWKLLKPVPPLAWAAGLYKAARTHSRAMIDFDQQSHQLPGEPALYERILKAGYRGSWVSENVFAYAKSVLYGHAGFAIDWGDTATGIQNPPGHRDILMSNDVREIGIGILRETNTSTQVGPLVITQNFGNRSNFGNSWLLGVAFKDLDGDSTYDAGEGLGGISIIAKGANGRFTTKTLSAGGYQIQVPPGTYTVTFSGTGLNTVRSQPLRIGAENVKTDAVAGTVKSDRLLGTSRNDTLVGSLGHDRLIGYGSRDTLNGGSGRDVLIGGTGSDTLIGGLDADIFLLEGGSGQDLIRDFQNGLDKLKLNGGIAFNQLTRQQQGDSTLIKLGSDELVLLKGIRSADITASDFIM